MQTLVVLNLCCLSPGGAGRADPAAGLSLQGWTGLAVGTQTHTSALSPNGD